MEQRTVGEMHGFARTRCLRRLLRLLVAALALAGCGLLQPAGIEVQQPVNPFLQPQQRDLHADGFTVDGLAGSCSLTPRANYRIEARVLHMRHYDLDVRAVCSPLDLALGWGSMADPAVDAWIDWRQSGRWYFYSIPAEAPFSVADVAGLSANVHIIPSSPNLSRALLGLEDDDVILLEGMLVDAAIEFLGYELQTATSLTRQDSGAGACEILYVERLVVDGMEYR